MNLEALGKYKIAQSKGAATEVLRSASGIDCRFQARG